MKPHHVIKCICKLSIPASSFSHVTAREGDKDGFIWRRILSISKEMERSRSILFRGIIKTTCSTGVNSGELEHSLSLEPPIGLEM
jgi:hypothetical protein